MKSRMGMAFKDACSWVIGVRLGRFMRKEVYVSVFYVYIWGRW